MTGQISIQAKVELPPGPPGFLEKVNVLGNFDITGGRFTKQRTQAGVNHLSKSAEGMSKREEEIDPRIVFSDIRGKVVAQHGTATLSQAAITVPGATATVSGTCGLIDDKLNLHGVLRTTGKLGHDLRNQNSPFESSHSVLEERVNDSRSVHHLGYSPKPSVHAPSCEEGTLLN